MKVWIFSAGILILAVYKISTSFETNSPIETAVTATQAQTPSISTSSIQLPSSLQSPFSSAAPPKIDQAAIIAARIERMKKLHYETPDRYNKLGIKELVSLASKNDTFAAIQLGERYWSEKDSAEWDPDFDFSQSNKTIAKKYFALAIRTGSYKVSDAVAVKSAEDGDMIDAEAWRFVSTALDKLGRYEHQVSANIRPLTEEEKKQSFLLVTKIWDEINISQ